MHDAWCPRLVGFAGRSDARRGGHMTGGINVAWSWGREVRPRGRERGSGGGGKLVSVSQPQSRDSASFPAAPRPSECRRYLSSSSVAAAASAPALRRELRTASAGGWWRRPANCGECALRVASEPLALFVLLAVVSQAVWTRFACMRKPKCNIASAFYTGVAKGVYGCDAFGEVLFSEENIRFYYLVIPIVLATPIVSIGHLKLLLTVKKVKSTYSKV